MSKPVIKINKDQLRVLSNPRRLEIHTSLRTDGPATAKELAVRLGGDEMGLYYHLRMLNCHGLIEASARAAATKPEMVYSVSARYLVAEFDLNYRQNRKEQCRNVDCLLRAASKEHRLAAELLKNELHGRSIIGRNAVRISRKDFKELQHRLRELSGWLDDHANTRGDRYSLSFFALPIVDACD